MARFGPTTARGGRTITRSPDVPSFGAYSRLSFNAPLSSQRADRLVVELIGGNPLTVLDLGCGWGELLLRILSALPEATGIGVDTRPANLDRGRSNAARRGLSDRVTFVLGEAREHLSSADLVLSIGAYRALGTIPEALGELVRLVSPGGRLLFGAEIWERFPTADQLANMFPGIRAEDCVQLPDLVDIAVAAGLRPLRIETTGREEWEEFESLGVTDLEEWVLANPARHEATELRASLDQRRGFWLRGHRDVMGFAYLTLGAARH